jgi:hypothetical protein
VHWRIFQVLGGSLGNWSAFENPNSLFSSYGCKVTNYFSEGVLWWSVIQQLGLIPRTNIQLKSIKVQPKFGDGGLPRLGGASLCSALDCHHSMANTQSHLSNHSSVSISTGTGTGTNDPGSRGPHWQPQYQPSVTRSHHQDQWLIVILILVLGSCGFLITPYFTFIFSQIGEVLPGLFMLIGEVIYQAPITYASGLLICWMPVIVMCTVYKYKSQWCDNPQCHGLCKAMELDIQLETEQCVRTLSTWLLMSFLGMAV